MRGTNRTISRLIRPLVIAALIAALVPTTAAVAAKRAATIKGTSTSMFPMYVHGTSVAIAPDGTPWFGISTENGLAIAHRQSGTLEIEKLREGRYEDSDALQFDTAGVLWFARNSEASEAIARRAPNGTFTEFALPAGPSVNALAFGPEGDVWFVRGGYDEKSEAEIGRMTPSGAITRFPLEAGADPTSIAVGPDGALWFTEEGVGKVGRITTGGEVSLFALAPEDQPRQIVAGPDGAMWFGENARARAYGKISDRIGRITVDGQVSELPVPFGRGTSALVSDPRDGVIWFATDGGEFASIAPSGNVSPPGCVGSCGDPIPGLARAASGALWFAARHAACLMCGGGSDLMIEASGTTVGKISAGALTPADPAGPPAVDPNANLTNDPPPPTARTEKPEEVDSSFAMFRGYVNSRGYPTTWLFRWGKTRTKRYEHKTFLPEYPFEAEEGAAQIEEEIYDLCPGTKYHYEIVAYGPGGRAPGGDRTFETKRAKRIPKRCLAH